MVNTDYGLILLIRTYNIMFYTLGTAVTHYTGLNPRERVELHLGIEPVTILQ